MQTISFALNYHLAGLNPFIYHLENILWHALAALLAYVTLAKAFASRQAVFWSALIFLIHPLQTEAIAYVSGGADPMLAVFLFLSFFFFQKYAGRKDRKYFFLSIVFFALSFLIKELAILFPGIILLYLFTLLPEKSSLDWKNKLLLFLPFASVSAVYLAFRKFVLPIQAAGLFTDGAFAFSKTAGIFFKFIGTYIHLFFFPAKLFMERPIVVSGFFDSAAWIGFGFCVFSLAGFLVSLRKKRVWAFGLGWFWLFLILSFFSFLRMGFLMEHWLYLPMLGPLVPLFLFLEKRFFAIRSAFARISVFSLFVLAVIFFSWLTIARNREWQEPISFYETNIARGAESGKIYNNLGMEYAAVGRDTEAIGFFEKAMELDSRLFGPWYNLAAIYEKFGDLESAEKNYLAALERDPAELSIYENLQTIYNAQGKLEEAIRVTEQSLATNPADAFMLANLGLLYESRGEPEKARFSLERALDLEPDNLPYREALDRIKLEHNE